MRLHTVLWLCLICPLMYGQQSRIAGPVAGYVFDGAGRAVRPIQGVTGASVIGDPVNFGIDIAAAYISPRQDYALVLDSGGALHLFRLSSGGASEVSLTGADVIPQRVVFSPTGSAAALVTSGKAQIFRGLPDAPAVAGILDLSLPRGTIRMTAAPGPPRRVSAPGMAVSDDGSYVLNVAAGSLWLLSTSGDNRRLMPAETDALVSFSPGSHDAALLDRFGLVLVHDVVSSAAREVVAPMDDGLASPVGLAFSAEGGTVYAASAAARGVALFDLSGGTRRSVSCDCTPSRLIPMGSTFRLNEPGAGPLWVLNTDGPAPRITFVPALIRE